MDSLEISIRDFQPSDELARILIKEQQEYFLNGFSQLETIRKLTQPERKLKQKVIGYCNLSSSEFTEKENLDYAKKRIYVSIIGYPALIAYAIQSETNKQLYLTQQNHLTEDHIKAIGSDLFFQHTPKVDQFMDQLYTELLKFKGSKEIKVSDVAYLRTDPNGDFYLDVAPKPHLQKSTYNRATVKILKQPL